MQDGLYRSTRDIPNKDGLPVALYLEISGNNGSLILMEQAGAACRASLSIEDQGGPLQLIQNEPARCTGTASSYEPYSFACTPLNQTSASCSVSPLSGARAPFTLTMEQTDAIAPADPSSNYLNPVE